MESTGTESELALEEAQKSLEIAIAGEINVDLILYGLSCDLPEERENLADGFSMTLGSSSAILAHNLSILGSKVSFSSRVCSCASPKYRSSAKSST